MTTSQNPAKAQPAHPAAPEDPEVRRIKSRMRALRARNARELASRVKVQADGSRMFVRFTTGEIIEHWVLLFSFLTLGVTGLLQRYSEVSVLAFSINTLFGGIESLRTIHHAAAIIFILVSVYHAARILYMWFVRREIGAMLPTVKDGLDLLNMFRYNLGLTRERPQFDRFSVEEKLEYWALIWGTVIMVITGFMQWYPTVTTRFLPGVAIPIARTAHSMEAILAMAAIATWHVYHTLVKERNTSIFNGLMSEHDMRENHPAEYARIMDACDYVKMLDQKPAQPPLPVEKAGS
jgi:formate dehydrogenase subunit gamma